MVEIEAAASFSILPIFFQDQDTFDGFGFLVFEPDSKSDPKKLFLN